MMIRIGMASCLLVVVQLVAATTALGQTVPAPEAAADSEPADDAASLGGDPGVASTTAPIAPAVEAPPEPEQPVVDEPLLAPAPAGGFGDRSLLFNLNNVFQNATVLGGWQGFGFGAQTRVFGGLIGRVGFDFTRFSDPADIVKTTHQDGDQTTVTYEVQAPVWTSIYTTMAAIDLLKPIRGRALEPYFGAGLLASYSRFALDYTDDLTVTDQVTDVHNVTSAVALGARGILGVAWRINPRFALFAEYHLQMEAVTWLSRHDQTTLENSASGTPATSRVTEEAQETRYFNLDVGLGQGAALGLAASF